MAFFNALLDGARLADDAATGRPRTVRYAHPPRRPNRRA
jgi:hypothetical protein